MIDQKVRDGWTKISGPWSYRLGRKCKQNSAEPKGYLMVELKRAEKSKVEGQVKKLLGESAAALVQKHEIAIQCKDLTEVTSKAEICTSSSSSSCTALQEASIVSARKAYGGIETATIQQKQRASCEISLGSVLGW